jgi:very-short-patch-repair endonuclease
VTFNEQQRDLIEDLLQDEAAADAAFRDAYQQQCARMDGEQDAGFFVKNLESVQGDERDVMILSTTFGNDPSGNFRRFFGPINLAGGERRLNVAITRAKLCNYLVTSMPLALISDRMAGGSFAAGASATGRDYLHAYMQYAQAVSVGEPDRQRQTLDSVAKLGPAAGASTRRSGESLFENEVRGVLEKLGYQVVAQVGDGGFQFDLAVLHPDPEKGFVLGIECDGKMYHPDWTARSRDLWRQRILEKRGWRIHRVWSINWWMNREAEIRALAARVESALRNQ